MEQSWAEAVRWYRAAAEQGDSRALFKLGWCYENGKGVPASRSTALMYYWKSSEKGYELAKEAAERLSALLDEPTVNEKPPAAPAEEKAPKRKKGLFFQFFH